MWTTNGITATVNAPFAIPLPYIDLLSANPTATSTHHFSSWRQLSTVQVTASAPVCKSLTFVSFVKRIRLRIRIPNRSCAEGRSSRPPISFQLLSANGFALAPFWTVIALPLRLKLPLKGLLFSWARRVPLNHWLNVHPISSLLLLPALF